MKSDHFTIFIVAAVLLCLAAVYWWYYIKQEKPIAKAEDPAVVTPAVVAPPATVETETSAETVEGFGEFTGVAHEPRLDSYGSTAKPKFFVADKKAIARNAGSYSKSVMSSLTTEKERDQHINIVNKSKAAKRSNASKMMATSDADAPLIDIDIPGRWDDIITTRTGIMGKDGLIGMRG